MNIHGPSPVNMLTRPDETGPALRLNQRLMAEVLQVSADRVTLALEGVQVVAQLTSPDQSVALQERRFAQFVVKDLNGPLVTLQYLPPGHAPPATGPLPALIPHLLQYAGLPENEANVLAARALLQRGLPVTAALVDELLATLNSLETWSEADAQAAAALKTAGLPLSAGTLALARQSFPPLVEMIAGLQTQIAALLKKQPAGLPAEILQNALAALQTMVVAGETPEALAAALQRALSGMGRSLEKTLAEAAQARSDEQEQPVLPFERGGLLALARLRGELARQGESQLLEDIDRFLDALRARQLPNVQTESAPNRESWIRMEIPLGWSTPGETASPRDTARLCIAAREGGEQPRIDPQQTRLVVSMDISPTESIQVDISVAGKKLGARIIASSDALQELAADELPALENGLERLGYSIHSLKCVTGRPQPADPFGPPAAWTSFNEISVEA